MIILILPQLYLMQNKYLCHELLNRLDMSVLHIIKSVALIVIVTMIIASSIAKKAAQKNIWKQDDNAVFEYLYDKLCTKSDYGHDLSQLNAHEQVFMAMALIAVEVNNGGFDQFFFNKGTRWNDIIVPAAKAIKAYEVAEICKKALEIYNEHSGQEDPIEELNECDQEFYNCNDPYMTLIAQYARNNKEYFKIK